MTDAESGAAVPRSASCLADTHGDFSICAKCGLAWRTGAVDYRPPCGAMSIARIREAVIRAITYEVASHDVCLRLLAEGTPADPLASLNRAAELRGVLRTLDRCLYNEQILNILNPNRRRGGK
jgi:hypothetical protein